MAALVIEPVTFRACSPAPQPTEFKTVSCKGNIYVWKLVIIEYVIKTKLICVIVNVSRICMQFFLSDDIEGSVEPKHVCIDMCHVTKLFKFVYYISVDINVYCYYVLKHQLVFFVVTNGTTMWQQ